MAEPLPTPRRATSRVARVYPLLQAGVPAYAIGAQVGLHGTQLTEAIRGNYRLGYVVQPPAEVRRAQHRANTSAARGGIALQLAPYLPLHLTARQTQVALQAAGGPSLSPSQIRSFSSRERHRHGVARPTAELTGEAQRDKRRSAAELRQLVMDRQVAWVALQRAGLPPPPSVSAWREREAHFEVRDALATQLRALLPPEVPLPPERHQREFLVAFWEHATYYQREGVLSLAYHPACYLAESESLGLAVRRLVPQLRGKQQALHISDEDLRKLLRAA